MEHPVSVSRTRIFGRDWTRTRWFIISAVYLCVLTAGLAIIGQVLLSVWPETYAHLIIESVGVLVYLGTIGLAIANAYLNDGVLPSTLLIVAPVGGLGVYLFAQSFILGTPFPALLTLDSLLSLGAGLGAISLGSYLLGIILYLRKASRQVMINENT